jgi:glycosyltransferase involved in cell wall biosynthesis
MTDIAIFLFDLAGGGAERVILSLAEGLAQRGYRVDLVVARRKGPYLANLSARINFVDLGVSRLILALPGLVRYLRSVQPRAMMSALDYTNIVAVLAARLARVSTRLILTEHNHMSTVTLHERGIKRRMMPWLVRTLYNRAHAVVAVSRGVETDLHRLGVDPGKTRTIYNPILTPELRRHLMESPDHSWLLSDDLPVILGIGRLCEQKDFSSLVRAFALVRQRLDARLMILGEGEQREELERLVRQLGLKDRVAFPGFVQQPATWLTRASLLVLSSRWEGFGNVIVEALAAGVPVVATDCDSGPAEILTDPRYGQLVPVGDIQAMAEAIVQTLERLPIKRDALRIRAEDFALDPILDRYVGVLFGSQAQNV